MSTASRRVRGLLAPIGMQALLDRRHGFERPRILLIAPHNSYRTAPFLEAAARLRVEVLIASEGHHSIVSAYAQGLRVTLSNYRGAVELVLAEARRRPFAGVIGTDDASAELAARIGRALGLPHNDPNAVRIARRKDLARARLQARGVRVPEHRCVDLTIPLPIQIEGLQFPCVVKPVALAASRGVIRADDAESFYRACARIAAILEHLSDAEERARLLVESFVPGFEVAVEGMLADGHLSILAVFDKPDPLDGPFFEETYYVTPSRLSGPVLGELHHQIAGACSAYGLREGAVHAECRVNDRGVWILEVASRTIGGLCARLFQFGTGHGLEEMVLAHAMGRPLTPRVADGGAAVLMIPIPEAGILRRVEGVTAASRVAYVEDVYIAVREGYELVPLPEGSSYLGFIFARAPTATHAEAALREAHSRLRVVVAPLWKAVCENGSTAPGARR